jgi:hypothetical protein
MVYLAAETGPILRDRLTEAVLCAARMLNGTDHATTNYPANEAATAPPSGTPSTSDTIAPATAERPTTRPRKSSPRTATKTAGKPRRVSREEYAARARAAYRPGVVITPAWVREAVPEISRGTSKVVADLLNDELSHHTEPTAVPDPAPTRADQATEQERAA